MNDPLTTGEKERTFAPPMARVAAEQLSKRETLELVKPVLREHDAEQEDAPPRYMDRDPFRDARWNWIYGLLERDRQGRRWLVQARQEIWCEDEYGHYWEPAWTSFTLIERGWHKWEVEVNYPRPIRRSEDHYTRDEVRRFRSKQRGERWARSRQRRYAKYIERLLAEGLYDSYGYE